MGKKAEPTCPDHALAVAAQGLETTAQLGREEIGDLERGEMAAALQLVPVEQAGIDRRRPAASGWPSFCSKLSTVASTIWVERMMLPTTTQSRPLHITARRSLGITCLP